MIPNLLLISHLYPPCTRIGGLRTAKFSKYLPEYGWEPIVLTREWPEESGGPEAPPNVTVYRTEPDYLYKGFRTQKLAREMKSFLIKQKEAGAKPGFQTVLKSNIKKMISFLVREIVAYPDENKNWIPMALKKAESILNNHSISAIFSTSPPWSSHIIACHLKKKTNLPWVADYRDPWTQFNYGQHTIARRIIERKLESKVIRQADLITTISHNMALKLEKFHKTRVKVITNGFDPEDYPEPRPALTEKFTLTYTGNLSLGRRDPRLLLTALNELLKDGIINKHNFRLKIFSRESIFVKELTVTYGIEELVDYCDWIPYQQSLKHQCETTALLVINVNLPFGKVAYSGKVFEYLGARRPILVIPKTNGDLDSLMKVSRTGLVGGSKDEIKTILKQWYQEFATTGKLSFHGKEEIIQRYTRKNTTRILVDILNNLPY